MSDFLPQDWREGTFVGRFDFGQGPTPILIRHGQAHDVSRRWPTVAALLNDRPEWADSGALGEEIGPANDLVFKPAWVGANNPRLLAPIDLQCVKAAGVTFAASTLERMIEERAGGDIGKAEKIREKLQKSVGSDILSVVPGSPEAVRLKSALMTDGLWSQYLEVAIGPDAEIFTKAPLLSSVGWGDYIGVRSDSRWNNSEPEIVLVCDRDGSAVGATLGNDVNLRDFEGRSALLLGKAKDNNASCSVGPFIRLFDKTFTIDIVRKADVKLEIVGTDNYVLKGTSSMSQISRDPLELARQAMSEHQYPDGFVLFMGTMFAPIQDRDTPGHGFTHKEGDIVRISSPQLGVLENRITSSKIAPPWTFGIGELITNLSQRGLL